LPVLSLEQLLEDPESVRIFLTQSLKPREHFNDYLRYGYYPFGVEYPTSLYQRINQVVRTIVENDMAELPSFDIRNARKLLQLIEVISGQVPFKPNIKELAEKTQIHRNSINSYLHYLEQAKIISLLHPASSSTATLQKREKIFLQNTTLLFALAKERFELGSIRETFVHSMLSVNHTLTAPKKGDVLVDNKFTLEVGGSTKKRGQIKSISTAWVVKDGVEIGTKGVLHIWGLELIY
jgi:predicted AAA+ superfamily ATPase